MSIQTRLTKSLQNSCAQLFVDELNSQEQEFRRKLRAAYNKREKFTKMRSTSIGYSSLMDELNSDPIAAMFDNRPLLVFSTEVKLTRPQQDVLRTLDGWYVYAMVYNMDDQCGGVVIKNHMEGCTITRQDRGIQSTITYQSFQKTQMWGIIYPNGKIVRGTTLPIRNKGCWFQQTEAVKQLDSISGGYVTLSKPVSIKRISFVPKETSEKQLKEVQQKQEVDLGIKTGKFTIQG